MTRNTSHPFKYFISTPVLDRQIETAATGQQQTCPSILESELFLDTMLKNDHYKTFKKEVMELQKTDEGIFNLRVTTI